MRLLRAAPATVYVAALSIAIAYGSPALYPGEEPAGDAQRSPATSLVSASDISYYFDSQRPALLEAIRFRVSKEPAAVAVSLSGEELECRALADGRWCCPSAGRIELAQITELRVVSSGER